MIIRTVQVKTRIDPEGNVPYKDMKIEINLEDLQDLYTQNGNDDAAIAKLLGETLMKNITLNKKKVV